MTLSVIIPALDEAAALPGLLADLRAQAGVELECIVADGGSRDDTCALAEAGGARRVSSARGRGTQMNAGAAQASGEFLLFLHADSRLPATTLLSEALSTLRAQANAERVAGHFPLRFVRTQPGHDFLFRALEAKTRLTRPGTINGDQGLLISRRYFDALGGFDTSLSFLEDQRIAARIFATGRWLLLPGELHTSARRFETEGHRERLALMALMMGAQAVGLDGFFTQAPQTYREQSQTARLRLAPFARLVRRLMRQQGARGFKTLYRGGRYVRENAWQLALHRDLRRNDGQHRSLEFHDRRIAPLLDNPAGDVLATLLLWLWLLRLSL